MYRPNLVRDMITWGTRTIGRWISLNAVILIYGAIILVCAFTRY